MRLLFQIPVRDVDCAFKLYKREVVVNMGLESKGALIDAEMLAKAKQAGYRITEVGVHHYPRRSGSQTGANPLVILRAFYELFRLRSRIRKSM